MSPSPGDEGLLSTTNALEGVQDEVNVVVPALLLSL